MRPSSKILVLVGAVLSFLLTARSVHTQSPSSPPAPTIRVETRQVLVPVIVTDRKGHYIKNLTAADFHIYDDGVEQKIVALNTQAGVASSYFPPQPVELSSKLPERLTLPSEGKGLPPSTYLICLDSLDSAFSNYTQVRRALEKLFRDQQASDAHYGLVILGRQTRIIQNLTTDPATILAALNGSELTGAITESETTKRTQEEVELTQILTRYCANCDCSGQNPSTQNVSFCSGDWHAIEGWAAAHAESRRWVTVDFLNDLRGLVERLGEVPGKRTIIYVSDGFNVQPGRELFGLMAAYTRCQGVLVDNTAKAVEPEIRQVVRAAQMRDVSFYTLDSRGVYTVSAFEINQTPAVDPFPSQRRVTGSALGPTYANVQLDRQTVATENQSALQELAAETGGDFFRNSNDYLKGLRQALDDGDAYYLLAYTPTSLIADGKFHEIKVNVGQKNVMVRAKKGYYAPAVQESPRLASAAPVPDLPAPPAVSSIPRPPPDASVTQAGQQSKSEPHADAPPPVAVNNSLVGGAGGAARDLHSAPVLMVDWPLPQLMHSLPQLQELKPTESQEELPGIMQRAGENVATFMQSFIDISSNEEVTEEQLKPDGKLSKQFKEKFDYLVLAQREPNRVNLQEYRADAHGKPVKAAGLSKGYMVTSGAFSAALCFHPTRQAESSFRYIGEQLLDGRKTYVVVFSQRAGSGEAIGLLRSAGGESSIPTFLQGIAWIDASTCQIVRLRTDVGPPRLDAAMWRLTSDIHYHEVHLPQLTSLLWVPDDVVVTMSLSDRMWRNEHHYADFKVFTVGSKLRSEPLE
jgi:VWFA-related protein